MPLIVDGVTIPQTKGSIVVDGVQIEKVVCEGVTVWEVPTDPFVLFDFDNPANGRFVQSFPGLPENCRVTGSLYLYDLIDGEVITDSDFRSQTLPYYISIAGMGFELLQAGENLVGTTYYDGQTAGFFVITEIEGYE